MIYNLLGEMVMTKDGNKSGETRDETLLLVRGSQNDKMKDKEYVKKLANAVLQVYSKHDSAKLRCVGAAALNNAIKSIIIAKGELDKKGESVLVSPSFTTVSFKGEEKTGIVLEVVPD